MSRYRLFVLCAALTGISVYAALSCRGVRLAPCMFHKITGLYCPGCGSTRAVLRLLHGDLAGALRANVLLFAVVPFLLFLITSQVRWKPRDVPNWVGYAAVTVLLGYWVARNIPIYPLSLLAPR